MANCSKVRVSRFVPPVIGLILITGAFAIAEARAQGPMGKILSRLDAYNQNLSSLKAKITMVKTDTGLGIADTTKGNIAYLPEKPGRPRYLRINWTEPIVEFIQVIGDDYKLYSPYRNLAIEGKTSKAQGSAKAGTAFAFIGMSAEKRRANFTAEYVGEEVLSDGTPSIHLILKPKGKADFRYADVWINGTGLPQQTKITAAANGDHTTILLSGVDENKKIDGKTFELTYKKGTVVKNM